MPNHRRSGSVVLALATVVALGSTPACAADPAKLGAATQQVETGAKKIGDGQVLDGAREAARGIGHTVVESTKVAGASVVEGARVTGRTLGEGGKAVGHGARSAWEVIRDGAVDLADAVVSFLEKPF